jgi:hypothetical protein
MLSAASSNMIVKRQYKHMFRKILFCVIPVFYSANLLAQGGNSWNDEAHGVAIAKHEFKAKRVIPPAPEAAELGKYGNTPISLFTGTPKVSIPLCELKGSSLSVPVSLSYNAGGFKPNDIATWVGLGWSLNAGGVVTRSVMANPDNYSNYFNTANTYTNIPAQADLFQNYDYMRKIQTGEWETQPDVYYYNFGNNSGKFVIKQDESVLKKEKNNLKISHCVNCVASSSSFTIVDEAGITYDFRDVEISTTTTDDVSVGGPASSLQYTFPSSWYLTSITSADGRESIHFTYHNTGTHRLFRDFMSGESQTYSVKTPPGGQLTGTSSSNQPSQMVEVNRKYLSRISLVRNGVETGYVEVASAIDQRQDLNHFDFPGERLVQNIKSYSRKNEQDYSLVKQYNFTFSYFQSANGKRLRLDDIYDIPVDGNTVPKPPYAFEYNNQEVPPYGSLSIDHWGFFNGAPNTTLIPTTDIGGSFLPFGGGADRNPDLAGSLCSVLQKIKYPTGGYTSFEYELHDAADVSVNNSPLSKPVGGLRVKQMTDYSFENKKAVVKSYEYKSEDGLSSGKAIFPGYLTQSKFTTYVLLTLGGGTDAGSVTDYTTLTASAAGGLGSVQGSHVGYKRVTEFQTDLNTNAPLGKTVYNYHIESLSATDDHISNGDLIEQLVYDNGDKLLFQQENEYEYSTFASVLAQKVQQHKDQDNKSILCKYTLNGNPVFEWKTVTQLNPACEATRYYSSKIFTQGSHVFAGQEKKLLVQAEKRYDQLSDSYITSTKKFFYTNPNHTLPTRIEQNSANDEVVVTEKKYTLDYNLPSSGTLDDATTGLQLLQNKNVVGTELESIQYRQNADGTGKKYINGMFTTYYPGVPYPKSIYGLEIDQPLTGFQLSSTNGNMLYNSNYRLLGSFQYDAFGNLQLQAKAQDLKKTYLWAYANTLPVAEITNAGIESVAYSSFETPESGNWSNISFSGTARTPGGITGSYAYNLSGNAITKTGLPANRQYIVSYWSAGGAATVSGSTNTITGAARNGFTYYEHLLPLNTTAVTISGSATIDELRLHPKDAQMITSTYNLFNGLLGSQTAPNNLTGYFDYDGYYRLTNIRDEQRNIVKNFKYNYGLGTAPAPSAQTLFYNQPAQGSFNKNTCPAGGEAVVVYKVPYGKHVSVISQADANQKAQADVTNNGQAYANKYGQCIYYNTAMQSAPLLRNNCYAPDINQFFGPPTPGMTVVYTVAARKHSSTISVADANAKAMADIEANKQSYANLNGGCTCILPYQKWIYYNGTWMCDDALAGARKIYTGEFIYRPNNPINERYECFYQFLFLDNTVSQIFSEFQRTPCSAQ